MLPEQTYNSLVLNVEGIFNKLKKEIEDKSFYYSAKCNNHEQLALTVYEALSDECNDFINTYAYKTTYEGLVSTIFNYQARVEISKKAYEILDYPRVFAKTFYQG